MRAIFFFVCLDHEQKSSFLDGHFLNIAKEYTCGNQSRSCLLNMGDSAGYKESVNAGSGNNGRNARRLLFPHLHELQPALFHFKIHQEPAGYCL